jgi:hypothetical protein
VYQAGTGPLDLGLSLADATTLNAPAQTGQTKRAGN